MHLAIRSSLPEGRTFELMVLNNGANTVAFRFSISSFCLAKVNISTPLT